MEKLTPKEIRFIENYLKNSGVFFFDVRLEMTDHVASELEDRLSKKDSRGFYQEFKDYMRLHKKQLLKGMRHYQWQADKKVLRRVFRNMFQPKVIVATAVLMGAKTILDPNSETVGLFILFGLTVMGGSLVGALPASGKEELPFPEPAGGAFFRVHLLWKVGIGRWRPAGDEQHLGQFGGDADQ